MRYEIRELSHLAGSPNYYVLVEFFEPDKAKAPVLVEDFIMSLADVGTRIATDKDGNYQLQDGSFIAPEKLERGVEYAFVFEQFKVDVPAEIDGNLQRRWAVAVEQKHSGDWTGDASKPALKDGAQVKQGGETLSRDQADPKGVLARADVAALVTTKVTKP